MLKHVGRLKNNQRKLVVAYRTVPGESDSCVCVTTENLEAGDHDALINLVESNAAQTANELAEVMARSQLPDGSNMLARFHTTGKMVKFKTADVEMTPDNKTTVPLDELNAIIAEQKGVSIDDLALKDPRAKVSDAKTPNETAETPAPVVAENQSDNLTAPQDGVISDEQLAASYRSQADRMFKEAKKLREQAEELAPTKKKKVANESA